MITTLNNYKQGTQYEYKNLMVSGKELEGWEINKVWNKGSDCRKTGSVISVILKRKLKVEPINRYGQ
jgi:hypothetical protein